MPTIKEDQTKKANQYYTGVGRRKTAVAQIRLVPGKGKVTINGTEIANAQKNILTPFVITGQLGQFDMSAIVRGGGITAQSDAIRLGIARALVEFDESLKPSLRKAGLMTRDPREKERKKPGLKRARKAPQWQKR